MKFLFINSLNPYWTIIKENFNFIWFWPSCSNISFKIIEFRVKEKSRVTWFELFIFDKFVVPFFFLFLNKGGMLDDILLYFIQFIKLCHSLFLNLWNIYSQLNCSPQDLHLKFNGKQNLFLIHQLIRCVSGGIPPSGHVCWKFL